VTAPLLKWRSCYRGAAALAVMEALNPHSGAGGAGALRDIQEGPLAGCVMMMQRGRPASVFKMWPKASPPCVLEFSMLIRPDWPERLNNRSST